MSIKKEISSPVPGVFYRRPSPEEDLYCNEGDTVKAGDTIGLVEVMKNFYEIKAEDDGVVETFNVKTDELVDAGQAVAILTLK
ncbi:acetyl-CoA carboxylase [Mesobacillus harenae]|uniref:acetyl-CoA carboxylase n=1 Tax=Mesobacillus harenae TaxID=2213203 RepID=UPI001580055C|nr:acetyl-CoA carboxylase [Mesobacillus harenae]